MKIYVDELPKSCSECKHKIRHLQKNFDGTKTPFMTCKFNKKIKHYPITTYSRWGDCPLQPLADHDKQVRKEMCEEIKSAIKEKLVYPDNRVDCPFDNGLAYEDTICDVIDQVQGDK